MSKAQENFLTSIQDAENLLRHFETLNVKPPPPPELEVLKRAGLIMAMTAWETYIEDRVVEAADARLQGLTDQSVAQLVKKKLSEEIKKLNNPTTDKAVQIFKDYADVDLETKWQWNGFDFQNVKERLDGYVKLRGDVVHRSRPAASGPLQPHRVKKEDLEKAIRFLKNLVSATEDAFESVAQ